MGELVVEVVAISPSFLTVSNKFRIVKSVFRERRPWQKFNEMLKLCYLPNSDSSVSSLGLLII